MQTFYCTECDWRGAEADLRDTDTCSMDYFCPDCEAYAEQCAVCATPDCDEPPAEGDDFCLACVAAQEAADKLTADRIRLQADEDLMALFSSRRGS